MPRLFCAICLPENLTLQLSLLKGGLTGARWVEPENYHITLRYFGKIDYRTANDLHLGLSQINRENFTLQIDRLDAFGNAKPHALIARIKTSDQLTELHNEIDWIARKLGISVDPRKFSPHITLARLKATTPQELAHFIASRGKAVFAPFQVNRFDLFSSKTSKGGGPYISNAHYELSQSI